MIPDKIMSKSEWEDQLQLRYDTMPPWYWNLKERQNAYEHYVAVNLKGKNNGH
jgi:hypothetical protein